MFHSGTQWHLYVMMQWLLYLSDKINKWVLTQLMNRTSYSSDPSCPKRDLQTDKFSFVELSPCGRTPHFCSPLQNRNINLVIQKVKN